MCSQIRQQKNQYYSNESKHLKTLMKITMKNKSKTEHDTSEEALKIRMKSE